MKESLIQLRPAQATDLPTLLEFEQDLIAFERPYAPNLRKDHFHYYDLGAYIADPDIEVVVAEIDDKLVGSGYALIRDNSHFKVPEKYIYLGFMYVVPEWRGKGINGMILDHLMEWGKTKGYSEFQLTVYAENESAMQAYKKKGFEAEILRMRLNKHRL